MSRQVSIVLKFLIHVNGFYILEESSSEKQDNNKNDIDEVTESAYKICDFVNKMESGLRIHMYKKHAVIEQLDGNVEFDESDTESEEYEIAKYPNSEQCI